MDEILNVLDRPMFDDRIIKNEYHAYQPFISTTYDYSDEVRICIQQMDLYTLPCNSYLYIDGQITYTPPAAPAAQDITMTNNFPAFLFDEMRYELNGVEIDHCKNVGITTTIKNLISLSKSEELSNQVCAWDSNSNFVKTKDDNFNAIIPLKKVFGFCEDYKRLVINSKQELILIRSKNDLNCIETASDRDFKIKLNKIQWWIPHIYVNDLNKLSLLEVLNKNREIVCSFRTWQLFEYPLLPITTKHTWSVKTSSQLEKPRYVIVAFQINRKSNFKKNVTHFDHTNVTNLKLFLNSEVYPYENLNLSFENNKNVANLYYMYANFRKSYYNTNDEKSIVNLYDFNTKYPLFVIDCSRQNESVKSGTVDIRIEFETSKDIANKTAAYCLILHDKIIQYNPLTNLVHKLV